MNEQQKIDFQKLFEKKDVNEKLYAILDAARSEAIYLNIDEVEHANLFESETAMLLAEAAPYLVELSIDDDFSQNIFTQEYGNSSMLFVYSHYEMDVLADFFRQYTQILLDGKKAIFAFYDPRVFHRFMRNADKEEKEEFFSVAREYACEKSPENTILVSYTYDNNLKYFEYSPGEINEKNE